MVFLKTKFSILRRTKREMPMGPKKKAPWEIALQQKAL